jgi:hypothetical protein
MKTYCPLCGEKDDRHKTWCQVWQEPKFPLRHRNRVDAMARHDTRRVQRGGIPARLGMAALFLALMAAGLRGGATQQHARDASTDGRLHACGLVTESGVTEHLHEYWMRCGRSKP